MSIMPVPDVPVLDCDLGRRNTVKTFAKFGIVVLGVSITSLLAGCGGAGNSGNNEAATVTPTPTPTPAPSASADDGLTSPNDSDPEPAPYDPSPLTATILDLKGNLSSDADAGRAFTSFEFDVATGKSWRKTGFALFTEQALPNGSKSWFCECAVESMQGDKSLRISYRFPNAPNAGWVKSVLPPDDMAALNQVSSKSFAPMTRKSKGRGWFRKLWKRISRAVGDALASVGEAVAKTVTTFVQTFVETIGGVVKAWVSKLLDATSDYVVGTLLATVTRTAVTTKTPLTLASFYTPAFADTSTGGSAAQAMVQAVREMQVA